MQLVGKLATSKEFKIEQLEAKLFMGQNKQLNSKTFWYRKKFQIKPEIGKITTHSSHSYGTQDLLEKKSKMKSINKERLDL